MISAALAAGHDFRGMGTNAVRSCCTVAIGLLADVTAPTDAKVDRNYGRVTRSQNENIIQGDDRTVCWHNAWGRASQDCTGRFRRSSFTKENGRVNQVGASEQCDAMNQIVAHRQHRRTS